MKTIKRFCFEGNITYYGSDEEVLVPDEYVEKDRETRGVWFSTVNNIDIPKMDTVDEENILKMKKYLDGVIEKLKEFKMNTVVFQVRPVNDALYESDINPWSSVLTGTEGKYPGFDVFGYFCAKAKENNISVHAWINPYRAGRDDIYALGLTKEEFIDKLDDKSFAKRHPECTILTNQNKLSLDPSSDFVIEYIVKTVLEIAIKYDIKAVHIDDYFYPYEGVNDPLEKEKCNAAGFININDFRRNNVNKLIFQISKALKTLDKKVEFGISPFSIYRTNKALFGDKIDEEAAWEFGSNNHPSCFNCYKGLYADIYKWMEEGWIDYITPQDYFDMDNTTVNPDGSLRCVVRYADVAKWWSWASKKTNIKLYMGQGIYKYSTEGCWSNPEETKNQLLFNQTLDNCLGTIFFTYRDLVRTDIPSLNEARDILKTLWTKEVNDI